MTSQNALRHIVAALDEANISYMLTGSFASSYHGASRASQDIDLVILATPDQLKTLVGLLPETEYYVAWNRLWMRKTGKLNSTSSISRPAGKSI